MSPFASRFRSIRKQHGLTQRELAKKLNISQSTIGLYETGDRNPDPRTIISIADFFDVSIDYLLGRTDNPDPLPIDRAYQKALEAVSKNHSDKEVSDRIREFMRIGLHELTGKEITPYRLNIIMANIEAVLNEENSNGK